MNTNQAIALAPEPTGNERILDCNTDAALLMLLALVGRLSAPTRVLVLAGWTFVYLERLASTATSKAQRRRYDNCRAVLRLAHRLVLTSAADLATREAVAKAGAPALNAFFRRKASVRTTLDHHLASVMAHAFWLPGPDGARFKDAADPGLITPDLLSLLDDLFAAFDGDDREDIFGVCGDLLHALSALEQQSVGVRDVPAGLRELVCR